MYLDINGSEGEGGGQILRSSLAMSSLLRQPVRIRNIREGRDKPGLQAQHLTCVNALASITDADVVGAYLGSQGLTFTPKLLRAGKYRFDVADVRPSAGAVSLVFQAIMLPLAFAAGVSKVTLLGGTHVPWSPSIQYLEMVYLPAAAQMGLKVDMQLKKWGWYPRGGGEAVTEIHPIDSLSGIDLTERGELKGIKGVSAIANLPLSIARRQEERALNVLKSEGLEAELETVNAPSIGKGSCAFLLMEFEKSRAGFTALGALGKRAEEVGAEAAADCTDFMKTDAAIDEHLADQLVLLMALAEGRSCFRTSRITLHLLTNIWVAEKFLPVKFEVDGEEGQHGTVSVKGVGLKS